MKTIIITERPDKKTSELLSLCKAKFTVWSYYNDERLDADFPAPNEVTKRAFQASQEPDSATLGLSVNKAESLGFKDGITLRERILLELAYFQETGNHLDVKGWTLCSGSRHSGGSVPGADWDDGKFRISWYNLDSSYSDGGIRSAVTLESFPSFPSGEKDNAVLDSAIQVVKEAGYVVYKQM